MATIEKTEVHIEIDGMDYAKMLTLWRNTPIGSKSPYFSGETGEYFKNQMAEKRAAISPANRINISKQIGW